MSGTQVGLGHPVLRQLLTQDFVELAANSPGHCLERTCRDFGPVKSFRNEEDKPPSVLSEGGEQGGAGVGCASQRAERASHPHEDSIESLPSAKPLDAIQMEHLQMDDPQSGTPLRHGLESIEVVGVRVEARGAVKQGAFHLEQGASQGSVRSSQAGARHVSLPPLPTARGRSGLRDPRARRTRTAW